MKLMTTLSVGFVVLVFALALSVGLMSQFGDGVLKEHLSRKIADVTGTRVDVAYVETNLLTGNITIDNIRVGNPQGFSDDIFYIESVEVRLDIRTLLQDSIVIEHIDIIGLEVQLEEKFPAKINVIALKNHVEQGEKAKKKSDPIDDLSFSLAELSLGSGVLNINSELLGKNNTRIATFSVSYNDEMSNRPLKAIIQGVIQRIISETVDSKIAQMARRIENTTTRVLPPAISSASMPSSPPLPEKKPVPTLPSKAEITRLVEEKLPALPPKPPFFRGFP